MSKSEKLSKEEIAGIIAAKQALSKLGMGSSINIQEICSALEIARKTAYSYHKSVTEEKSQELVRLRKAAELDKENNLLKERIGRLEDEIRLWKIVKKGIDDLKKKGLLPE